MRSTFYNKNTMHRLFFCGVPRDNARSCIYLVKQKLLWQLGVCKKRTRCNDLPEQAPSNSLPLHNSFIQSSLYWISYNKYNSLLLWRWRSPHKLNNRRSVSCVHSSLVRDCTNLDRQSYFPFMYLLWNMTFISLTVHCTMDQWFSTNWAFCFAGAVPLSP